MKVRSETERVQNYWNGHIHDLEVVNQPVGTPGFFNELAEYRFGKLQYLPKRVDFGGYQGADLLEVGCGVGVDLVRFATGGANVTGIDLAESSIDLARQNFQQRGLDAKLLVMNGEAMQFADNRFDVVYAHGVLQYTPDPRSMISEIQRVLRPGGRAILMVYNRRSWLYALSKLTGVPIEHHDAPCLRMYSPSEFRSLLREFDEFEITAERFPVPTEIHEGVKAVIYNDVFVRIFDLLPKYLVRPFGWHLLAFATIIPR